MVMTIPLEKAIRLLQESSAVIIDNDEVLYARLFPTEEEGDEGLFWKLGELDESCEWVNQADFYRQDNQEVTFAGGSLWLIPRVDGVACPLEEYQITLLEPMDLERITRDMEAIEKQDTL
jgi:hypothetical protein